MICCAALILINAIDMCLILIYTVYSAKIEPQLWQEIPRAVTNYSKIDTIWY